MRRRDVQMARRPALSDARGKWSRATVSVAGLNRGRDHWRRFFRLMSREAHGPLRTALGVNPQSTELLEILSRGAERLGSMTNVSGHLGDDEELALELRAIRIALSESIGEV